MLSNQNVSPLSFKARVSPQILRRIDFELQFTVSKKYAQTTIDRQLKTIPDWGSKGSELVISRNTKGNKCIGLKMPLENGFVVSWPIEYLKGKTILSQMMNLRSSHLNSTVQTIKFLYSKYGLDIFEKAKNSAPHVR
ncbi:MAG TPA: hypothetical protein IAD26_00055 [Candidatus Limenecus avicola]|mgnify:FL=1|uniref:Uncharacterized protein n=1 Tax=Candidatus Limenecus avicola TaxID=2840847 RepID=A0A9D1MYT4_9CLOT|nr:hypothetical protein [Candidatus Limenecus avicola]